MNHIRISDRVIIGKKLTLIGGPCVVESLEMCKIIAGYLQEICAGLDVQYIFKASFDKANRSSVKSFRGPGLEEGLKILAEIKRAFKVPVVTDIHEAHQAAPAAEVADILQIPAFLCRQTDLLAACAATGRAVNIKKGQFMAPEDMRGAVEKVREAGNNQIMLTERGTSFGYHNLVVDMRALAVMRGFGVPVVFDATHSVQLPGGLGSVSGGRREFIRPLARAAAAVGIDALFTEVHPEPEKALSDGPNSLNFALVKTVLQEVKAIYDLAGKNR
ncbi:MAG: 3-deoxy-8-phosphooctulonate synthase [Victivallaceae bacterium]|nr:3-deoxy-8-phosphooctulonate synthase [Victivallaceae bacterium]